MIIGKDYDYMNKWSMNFFLNTIDQTSNKPCWPKVCMLLNEIVQPKLMLFIKFSLTLDRHQLGTAIML